MTERDASWLNPFTLQGRVGQRPYIAVGFALMLLKYGVEAATMLAATGMAYTPLEFFSPFLSTRAPYIEAGGEWLGWAWLLWTVPFVWIAVAMSLRRARDAGLSGWVSLFILVPLINFAVMIGLSLLPTKEQLEPDASLADDQLDDVESPWTAPDAAPPPMHPTESQSSGVLAGLAGIAAGGLYAVLLIGVSTMWFHSYGVALFFGTPLVAGATAGYLFNRPTPRGAGATTSMALGLVAFSSAALLLVGLEGAICILMAIPLLGPLVIIGAWLGESIAENRTATSDQDDRGLLGCLLILPMVAAVEPMLVEPLPRSVVTSIDIDAPPAEVWETVIAFPDIDAPPAWYFRWGIAAPERARIEGVGVGAVRHCEFTTGAFVEPITVWDEPHRLAFDVTDQPEPMFELSPYKHLHPPHLDRSFRSTRGEFLLEPLPDGGTRLIGTTWYELDIAPHAYWRWWTDAIVHRIHLRVLEHIKHTVEQSPESA